MSAIIEEAFRCPYCARPYTGTRPNHETSTFALLFALGWDLARWGGIVCKFCLKKTPCAPGQHNFQPVDRAKWHWLPVSITHACVTCGQVQLPAEITERAA